MAISALSSASSLSALPAVGPLMVWAKLGPLSPVRPIQPVLRDAYQGFGLAIDQGEKDPSGLAGLAPPALDRRSAESIIGRNRVAVSGQGSPLAEAKGRGPVPGASLSLAGDSALARGARDRGLEGQLGPGADPESAALRSKGAEAKDPGKLSRKQIEDRLAELEGEKGAKERERTSAAAGKNAEASAVIAQLKARDGEVRAHEAAHIAAGGRYITGGASYSYQRGPDGSNYAIGGEVGIDSSPLPGKPEETIAKMQIVRAAALAPADPSGADLSVAGAAAQAMAQAMAEIANQAAKAPDPSASAADTPPRSDARDSGGVAGSAGALPGPIDPVRDRHAQAGATVDLIA